MENVENKIKGNISIEESFERQGYKMMDHETLFGVKRIFADKNNELFFTQKSGLKNWVDSKVENFNPPVSKSLVPQNALINVNQKKIVIVEYFSQTTSGSLDTKLTACDFRRKQYNRQFKQLEGYKIEYVLVVNEWFADESYKDWIDYVVDSGCKIYFTELEIEEVL